MIHVPPCEFLRSILAYDPGSGTLSWKWRVDAAKKWNARWAGKTAGSVNRRGYVSINIGGRSYKAHRIAYVHAYGDRLLPGEYIDHANGDPSDNRLINLRIATCAENNANSRGWSDRVTDLPKGVYRSGNKYVSQIVIDGHPTYLGTFVTPALASAAHSVAAQKAYGKFARTT